MDRSARIEKWTNGEEAPPSSIQIQPSNSCNLKCKQCARNFEKLEGNKISDERLLKLIEEAGELGVNELEFTGRVGEPLTRDLVDAVEKVKNYNMEGNLLTNGTLLNDKLIESLVRNKWDTIVFSVDAPRAEMQDSLRGVKGTYDRVVKNIKKINDLKNKLGVQKPSLLFLTVLNNWNIDELDEIIDLAEEINVDMVQVRPMIVHEKAQGQLEDLKIGKDKLTELRDIFSRAKDRAAEKKVDLVFEHDIETLIDYYRKDYDRNSPKKYEDKDSEELKEEAGKKGSKKDDMKCLLPFSEMVVFAEGTVSPCCVVHSPEPDKYIDSILDKTLEEVWYGEKFERFRNDIKNGKLPEPCQGCFL